MALATAQNKLQDAREAYEKIVKKLGKGLREAIVAELSEKLPKGWYVEWHQSDKQYNDEDYYFGLDQVRLISERVPRQGKLLREAVPDVVEERADRWGQAPYKVITKHGSKAEYEWFLDDECPAREFEPDWGEPGRIELGRRSDTDKNLWGLTEEVLEEFQEAFDGLDDGDFERAFGDEATVTIFDNGSFTVNDEEEDEEGE